MRKLLPKPIIAGALISAFPALLVMSAAKETPNTSPASSSMPADSAAAIAGSSSCRDCHATFYELWSTSFHGLAMQPYTPLLARTHLQPQREEIAVGQHRYLAEIEGPAGLVRERGPEGEKRYPIVHVMGGKNVYYFLTPLDRGRLQVLPVAYDVRRREWYDTAASAMRHFSDVRDQPLDWRDPLYTFNTSCYGCHVSQLAKNYNLATDTYHTTWAEPGINCETCHGPAAEHVRVFNEAPPGHPPEELHLISTKTLTADQRNALCAPCHAKMSPITDSFMPGERYFDHYDLTGLENPDFYPDGRDLGENYTYTSWLRSPCLKNEKFDCLHCHTSSGRYRFKSENPNGACLPCHQERVENATAHTHHKADSPGSLCISCHMPMTEFARILRSDHSMHPPTPAATLAFKSPNACNICHTDKDAAWADEHVRQWHADDYQAPILYKAGLIDAARRNDWKRLPEMLAILKSKDRDEVYAASLVRLLRGCGDERKWPALIEAMKDSSPLVRSSAADALDGRFTPETIPALIGATRDEYRLVRVRAAAALAGLPPESLNEQDRRSLASATSEFVSAMNSRPDDFASHYNLGNFHMERRDLQQAISSFEISARLRPDHIAPLVNVSLAYNELRQNDKAEQALRRALKVEPASAAANLNLGLLMAEMRQSDEAEKALRAALKADPRLAVAAYNLGILLSADRIDEAIDFCRKAAELQPNEPKYAYTAAFFQYQNGDAEAAARTLQPLVDRQMNYPDAYALLGQIFENVGRKEKAIEAYRKALDLKDVPNEVRAQFAEKIRSLSQP
ncbi:MAG TPA: tetratricopeptide repeat protein [Phycisphaerae bacterium]|nr:tetratricopeptide repeat protein [Phycisphaerae bacterium]